MGVESPYPPVYNEIVTPHLFCIDPSHVRVGSSSDRRTPFIILYVLQYPSHVREDSLKHAGWSIELKLPINAKKA